MMTKRSTTLVAAAGFLGIAFAVAVPVLSYARMRQAERAAADAMRAMNAAQRAFRAGPGRGAYATDLSSLITPCPGNRESPAERYAAAIGAAQPRYVIALAPAQRAETMGTDCRGRVMASDYYATAAPRTTGVDGQQALASRSDGRVFVFFDGVPPREADMNAGGLAVLLDSLPAFKIP